MWSLLDEHRHYISDAHRLSAFDSALREVVRPTDVVLDLGCGTGVLGLLACRAGARHVYSVDASDMIDLAREVVRAGGLASRITTIRGHSTGITLPEPVDVVVGDQLGGLGVEAGVFDYYRDARRRLLAAGGRFVPSALALSIAPVDVPDAYAAIDVWQTPRRGVALDPIRRIAANTLHPLTLERSQLLGGAVTTEWVDPSSHEGMLSVRGTTTAARHGVLHGLGGWFTAQLSAHVRMSNAPHDPTRIARRNTLLPMERPIAIRCGDRVAIDVGLDPVSSAAVWRVRVEHLDGRVDDVQQRTLDGTIVTRETLALTSPDATPQLDTRQRAERDVLVLCDGTRSVADIEVHLRDAYPALFPTRDRAAVFVAQQLRRQGR